MAKMKVVGKVALMTLGWLAEAGCGSSTTEEVAHQGLDGGKQEYGGGEVYQKLVTASQGEMAKTGGRLTMALDWPNEHVRAVLLAFREEYPFIREIDYTRETGIGPFGRYLIQFKQGQDPRYDIMHVASEFEDQYWMEGLFIKPPFDYRELSDALPEGWPELDSRSLDEAGNFVSTTGHTRGIVYNRELVSEDQVPTAWEDCLDPKWKGRILLDIRNKLQALQHDPETREAHLEWLRGMMRNQVVLTNRQGVIVGKVASGEFPLACGINYHTVMRIIDSGVKTIGYIQPGPYYPLELGSRIFVGKWSKTPATTQLWALWISTAGQKILERSAYRGFPWIPESRKHEMAEGKHMAICGAECVGKWGDYNTEYQELLGLPTAVR